MSRRGRAISSISGSKNAAWGPNTSRGRSPRRLDIPGRRDRHRGAPGSPRVTRQMVSLPDSVEPRLPHLGMARLPRVAATPPARAAAAAALPRCRAPPPLLPRARRRALPRLRVCRWPAPASGSPWAWVCLFFFVETAVTQKLHEPRLLEILRDFRVALAGDDDELHLSAQRGIAVQHDLAVLFQRNNRVRVRRGCGESARRPWPAVQSIDRVVLRQLFFQFCRRHPVRPAAFFRPG